MLTAAGCKVLDFGLARQAGGGDVPSDGPTMSAPTGDNVAAGTLPYMAPEQLDGKADTRSDIWALGCILYETATGERAFGGTSKARLMSSILSSDPISVARLRPEVPERLDWLVRRCLEKDPERRWQSTKDVAIEIESLREEAAKAPAAPESRSTDCSVAVLPFVNMSSDPDQEYFADGLAEELINALTKVRGLKVIARTSAFSFKGTNADIATIASKLGVATIVEGSVRKAGNRIRITAQLIDVGTGHHLWSEVYDRTLDDIFEVQEQIARSIVTAIQPSLLGDSAAPLVVAPTTNQKAYELYLRSLAELSNPTREHLLNAEGFLREAVELDPGFAAAHATLAFCYTHFGSYGVWPWGKVKKHAESAAQRALALDPKLAEVHAALGHLRLVADWDPAGAHLHAQTALELDPSSERARHLCGLLARVAGTVDEAVSHFQRACELEPLSLTFRGQLGRSLLAARQYDAARREMLAVIEQSPQSTEWNVALIETYLVSKREPEAIEVAARWLESLRHPELAVMVRDGYRDGGIRAAMAPVIRWLVRGLEQFGIANAFTLATFLAQLGEIDQALEWLEHSRRQREANFLDVNVRPGLDPLRSDPRFVAIVERSGLARR